MAIDRIRLGGVTIGTQNYVDKREAQDSVIDRVTAPPGSPSHGDRYLIIATATGVFSGHEDDIATWRTDLGPGWLFVTPSEGFRTWVDDEAAIYVYESGAWSIYQPAASPGGSNTELQWNNAGTLDGISQVKWDSGNSQLELGSSATLVTGGEGNPDVGSGGLCLYLTSSFTNNIFSMKSSGFTISAGGDSDTFAFCRMVGPTGGLRLDARGQADIGFWLRSDAGFPDTTTTTSSDAAINLAALDDNASVADSGNIFAITNATTRRILIKGSGRTYWMNGGIDLRTVGSTANALVLPNTATGETGALRYDGSDVQYYDGSWNSIGGASPGGSSGDLQYNDGSGGFGGESQLTWNAASDYLELGSTATITTGGETAPDADYGGITLKSPATSSSQLMLTVKGGAVNHGMTSVAESDTAAQFAVDANYGRFIIQGFSDAASYPGLVLEGFAYSDLSSAYQGAVTISGYTKSGTGYTSVSSSSNILCVRTYDDDGVLFVKGNGDIFNDGRVVTGGETSPNCHGGGLLLRVNGSVGSANDVVIKTTNMANGFSSITQSDDMLTIDHADPSEGGVYLNTYTDGTRYSSLMIQAHCGAGNTSTSTTAQAPFEVRAYEDNGSGGRTTLSSFDNLMVIRNGTTTRHIFKGDGDFRYDGSSTSYDGENDIALVAAARYTMAKEDVKIRADDKARLEELGVIENGFVSLKKMTALQLGAVGQLWNMVRGLARQLGLEETALLTMARNYTL